MKRVCLILTVLALMFLICSCGSEKETKEDNVITQKSETSFSKEETSEPEQKQEEPEEKTENADLQQCFVKYEDGITSGILQTCIYIKNMGGTEYSGEFAGFSFVVPEGWKMETLEKDGSIYGFSFAVPWSEDRRAMAWFYKDEGKVYDDLLEINSLWVGLDEYTYHEISGNFSKGSYIRFDYPSPEKYDVEEDFVPVYGRFHQLQFDGCVVSVNVYIRIDSEENTAEDERICDEFISSIEIF